jgi:ribosome-associated toxin RatA of RatAB toxin-antitoxin module
MTIISRSALVMYQPIQMYDLVNDVEAYPQFLTWCNDVEIVEKSELTQTATISISMAAVNQRFTTRNTMQPGAKIEMLMVDGPFSYLTGCWKFKPLGDHGCKVLLNIQFDFSNQLISKSLGPIFSGICGSLVEQFCNRANEVY